MQRICNNLWSKAGLLVFNLVIITALVVGVATESFAKKKAADEVASSTTSTVKKKKAADKATSSEKSAKKKKKAADEVASSATSTVKKKKVADESTLSEKSAKKKKKAADDSAPKAGSAAAIDLNTADQKSLESLPGIGPATAKAIIAGRPYKSVDDLKRVKGVSDSKLKAIRDKVIVGAAAATPAAAPARKASSAQKEVAEKSSKSASKLAPGQRVNINSASKEELEMLPGIGPAKSQAIIDGRPYTTVEDIMKVKGIKQGIFSKIKDNITVR